MADSSELELISTNRLQLEGEPTYSVSEINELVQAVLREQFPKQVWVRGEIQGYDSRKHREIVSFTLAEKSSDSDDVFASVTAILFPQDRQVIEQVLQKAENAFQLQDGIEVRFRVEVDLWVKAGRYQLRVHGIDPTYTLGRIAQNRKRIIELLTQRGLMNRNKSLALCLVPLRIGLIAAKGSAGYNDFVTHLKQSGFRFTYQFIDSAMQGSQVEADVVHALRVFNQNEAADVIVITRGGGAATDLSWFDRYGLAEAIATSRVPVLTGLGHTHDTSVIDLVAYADLKTPTDAAQFLINRVTAFLDEVNEAARQLREHVERLFEAEHASISDFGSELAKVVRAFVSDAQVWLVDRQRDMSGRSEELVSVQRQFLQGCVQRMSLERIRQLILREQGRSLEFLRRIPERASRLIQRTHHALLEYRQTCTYPRLNRVLLHERDGFKNTGNRIRERAIHLLTEEQLRLQGTQRQVGILDPIRTLMRGFSIVRNAQGVIISKVSDVQVNESMTTEVIDGSIKSRVQAVEPRHKEEPGG